MYIVMWRCKMEEMVILFVTDIVKLFMSFKIKFILWGPF